MRRPLRLVAFVGVVVLGLAVPASAQDTTTTVPTTSSSVAVILGVAPSTVSLPGEVAAAQEVSADTLAFTGWSSALLVVLAGALVACGLMLVSASRRAAPDAGLSRSRSGPG